MGTSPFAVRVLERLVAAERPPVLVVTPPDRPAGRGRKLSPPPVAVAAGELGLPLHQTASVSAAESLAAIRESGAEVGCVCAFGQLIKEPLLSEMPMLNVHPSLLPRWRGAAPIERAIMSGDERTGVAVMRLTEGLDSGPVALTEEVTIGATETFGELADRLADLGGDLLVQALELHERGELVFTEQPEEGVTYAEKITADDRRLEPARPAAELDRTVRALTPHVGAFFDLPDGDRLGVTQARPVDGPGGGEPGATQVSDGALVVSCADGAFAIERLKPPGKREMAAADWLRGHEPPARLGTG
jgi:methionyl-tRNA formyltransferase